MHSISRYPWDGGTVFPQNKLLTFSPKVIATCKDPTTILTTWALTLMLASAASLSWDWNHCELSLSGLSFSWLLMHILVRAPDSWSKGCEVESRQERRENFLPQSQLRVLTLIRCPFHRRVTAVARERPRSFCQKCRWQVTPKYANTFDRTKVVWADYAAIQA